jgi:predicted metal-dependent enzyme (double-stranded beta helix superfamily)
MAATATRPTPDVADLIDGVRAAIAVRADWVVTAQLVAEELRSRLPGPDLLTAEQRLGSSAGCCRHLLHVDPDGSFSIVALVWRPGQKSGIHDHVSWSVHGPIVGEEYEELYDVDLNLISNRINRVGVVSSHSPPGDIHQVGNNGDSTTISIHIYGCDIPRLGGSARRFY